MKKIYYVVCLFMILILTGCFKKEPTEVLSSVVENMNDIKSVEILSNLHANMKQDGVDVNVDVPFTLMMQGNENDLTMKLSLGENMFLDKLDAYFKLNNETMTVYFPDSLISSLLGAKEQDKWLKLDENLNKVTNEVEMTKEEKQQLEKLQNIDYISLIGNDNFVFVDEIEALSHYQLIINDALIERFAQELEIEIEKMNRTLKIDMYIDSNYNLVKLEIDMKEFVGALVTENRIDNQFEDNESDTLEDEKFDINESIKELTFKMEFKNINKTTVSIPSEVINNAINYDEYEFEFDYDFGLFVK